MDFFNYVINKDKQNKKIKKNISLKRNIDIQQKNNQRILYYKHLIFDNDFFGLKNFDKNIQKLFKEIQNDANLLNDFFEYNLSEDNKLNITFFDSLLSILKGLNKKNQSFLLNCIPDEEFFNLNIKKIIAGKQIIYSPIYNLIICNTKSINFLIENRESLKRKLMDNKTILMINEFNKYNYLILINLKLENKNNELLLKKKEEIEQLKTLLNKIMKDINLSQSKIEEEELSFLSSIFEYKELREFIISNKYLDTSFKKLTPYILITIEKTQDKEYVEILNDFFSKIGYPTNNDYLFFNTFILNKISPIKTAKFWFEKYSINLVKEANYFCEIFFSLKAFQDLDNFIEYTELRLRDSLHSKIIIKNLLTSLIYKKELRDIFLNNLEDYLIYFKKNEIEINDLILADGFYLDIISHFIRNDNNLFLSEKHISILKNNKLNPFEKNQYQERLYDKVSLKTKNSINLVFLKELADFEKNILVNSIKKENSYNTKKRL